MFPPNGTCAFSGEVDFNGPGITLEGHGPGTTLLFTGAGDAIVFGKDHAGNGYNNRVDRLRIIRQDQIGNFTGFISGSTLTVTAVTSGTLAVGETLALSGVASGTTITSVGPNTTNGTGTYTVSVPQTLPSGPMRAGSGPTSGVGLKLIRQGPFWSSGLVINDFYNDLEIIGGGKMHIDNPEMISGEYYPQLVSGSATVNVQPYVSSASFTGSISNTTLNVSSVSSGYLEVGQIISGNGVAAGTSITGPGVPNGTNTAYPISFKQTIASESMSSLLVINPSGIYLTSPALGGVLNYITVDASLLIGGVDGIYTTDGHFGNSNADIQLIPTQDNDIIQTVTFTGSYLDGAGPTGAKSF